MKYAIKILKEAIKKEIANKAKAIKNDSYKGVIDSGKNIEDLEMGVLKLESKPAPSKPAPSKPVASSLAPVKKA